VSGDGLVDDVPHLAAVLIDFFLDHHVNVPPMSHPPATFARGGSGLAFARHVLLRKEVIQPHLPVRLPCYDFVPIASPTFDGSLPCGLGHRLRVLPTFVT
jgi:hypothetical protein